MFGALLKLFHNKKHPLQDLANAIASQHKKLLSNITLEARLLGVLDRPNEKAEVTRYYQSVASRYNTLLSYLHHQAYTDETLRSMRKLAQGVHEITDRRLVKRLRYRFLEYFEYVGQIKKLEREVIQHYIETIEVFRTENLKFRFSEDVSESIYQSPIPLNTIFSSI